MIDEDVWARLAAAGVVDAGGPDRDRRIRALELLLERGATVDELIEYSDDLGYVAARIVNGGQPTMTRRQLAERCNIPLGVVDRLSLATGITNPGADVPSATDQDVPMLETFAAASLIFGEETSIQLGRVVGVATARMADAISSAYRTAVAPRVSEEDNSGLALVESNLELAELLPTFMTAVEQLLRRHIVAGSRPTAHGADPGVDATELCVGFVDLVGSTALAGRVSTNELSMALTDFEAIACDAVVTNGGRVVKLIGDEIMFTNPAPLAAVQTVASMIGSLMDHPLLPPARGGLAFGDVLTRDGDCFGPTVNLAARVVPLAEADQLVVDEATAQALRRDGIALDQLGDRELKGFTDRVAVFAVQAISKRVSEI